MPKVVDVTRILSAAIATLMARGYEGATTREIAEVAGVNEVTLFRKYGTKARLFEIAFAHQLSDTPLDAIVFTGDLEADLLAIVQAYVETNEAHGDVVPVLLVELTRNPDLQGAMSTPLKNIQRITQVIQKYQKMGLLKTEPPLLTLSSLIGPIMIRHLLLRAHLQLPVPAVDPQMHVDRFLNGRRC